MGMEGTGTLGAAEEVEAERADQLSRQREQTTFRCAHPYTYTVSPSSPPPWPYQEVAEADCAQRWE